MVLFMTMLFTPMASYAYYSVTSHFNGTNMPKLPFDSLQEALSKAPLISPLDYDRDYILYLSASEVSVAGVLVQVGDDQNKFMSSTILEKISQGHLSSTITKRNSP
jgi:hypothetical protein